MTKAEPGTYIRHSKYQIEYLKQHLGKEYDKDVASKTGLSIDQIRYYRTTVLKIRKPQGKPKHIPVSINSIREELTALINFYATYNGCMKDTIERRINMLKTKI